MSFFFLLNPKVFFDAGGITLGGLYDTIKKKKKVTKEEKKSEKTIEANKKVIEEVVFQPKPNPYTEEFNKTLQEYLNLMQLLQSLNKRIEMLNFENQLRRELEAQEKEYLLKRAELARQILLLQEEEDLIVSLILADL